MDAAGKPERHIMSDPKHPQVGEMSIDATDVNVVYYTPDQVRRLTKTRPGYEKALTCLGSLTPEQAKVLGISEADRVDAMTLAAELRRIEELRAPAEEMLQRLHHGHLHMAHRAATLVHGAATMAKSRAHRDPEAAEVLGALDDLVDYTEEPAAKAKATRAKKAKKLAASGTGTGNGSQPA